MNQSDFLYRIFGNHLEHGSITNVVQGMFKYNSMMNFLEELTSFDNFKTIFVEICEINDKNYKRIGEYKFNDNGSQLKLNLSNSSAIPAGLFKFQTIDTPTIHQKICLHKFKHYFFDVFVNSNPVTTNMSYTRMLELLNVLVDKENFDKIRISVFNLENIIKNHGTSYAGKLKFNQDGSKLVPDLTNTGIFQLCIMKTEINTPEIYKKLHDQYNQDVKMENNGVNTKSNKYLFIYNNCSISGTLDDMAKELKYIPTYEIEKVIICDLNDNTVYKISDILSAFKTKDGKKLSF